MAYSRMLGEMNALMYVSYLNEGIKTSVHKMKTKQLILQELLEIIGLFPEVSIAKHLCTIMRPYKDAYNWNDELLLKKIERYRNEIETDDDGEE